MVERYENVIEFLTVGMETKNENVQDLSYIDTTDLGCISCWQLHVASLQTAFSLKHT